MDRSVDGRHHGSLTAEEVEDAVRQEEGLMRTRNRWIRPWSVAVAAGLLAGLVWRRRRQPRGVGGNRWYSLVYRICYRIGFTPWDRGVPTPELVRFVEGPAAPATGRALDIGCGTGVN